VDVAAGRRQPTVKQKPDADLEPGLAVRHLVHAGRRRHRERQHDREAARHARRAERPARPARLQHDEISAVLDEYGRGGLYDNWDTTDAERSVLESRENPAWNRSGLISMMEFNGNVQGRILQDYGMAVPDELRDYHVQVWVIGSHVIKAHLSPSPRSATPTSSPRSRRCPARPSATA
jgi:hypothetical protein